MNNDSKDFRWNLFPFRREEILANRRKRLIQFCKTLLSTVIIVTFSYFILCGFNQYLNDEIQQYARKESNHSVVDINDGELEYEKTSISTQIQNLENLSDSRMASIDMLAILPKFIQSGEYLLKIEVHQNTVVLEGKAESSKEINDTLQHMQKNDLFIHPKIIQQKIEPSNFSSPVYFTLMFTLRNQES